MIECPVDHPALTKLFDPHVPNNPALWAVLMGRHDGEALVDNLQHPSQCLLHTKALLTYASREISQDFLTAAVNYFRKQSSVWLIHKQGDTPAPAGYRLMPRLEFYDVDRNSSLLADFRSKLPIGHDVRLIDMELLQRCEWREDMVFYCGSLENFLRHDLGVCLVHGNEIIVEAYTSALGDPYAETGAITHEPYRGKGYAPIAIAYLIDMLEKRGYRAYWSCDVDNLASARVAHKLGFRIERPYEILEYEISA